MFKIIIQAKKRILPAFIMVEIPPTEQISKRTIASLIFFLSLLIIVKINRSPKVINLYFFYNYIEFHSFFNIKLLFTK